MSKLPWLMITLSLISTIYWSNSIAQNINDYNSYWKGFSGSLRKYSNRPKRTNVIKLENTTSSTTSWNIKDQNPVGGFIQKNPIMNTTLIPTNDFKLLQTKSAIVFPSSNDKNIMPVSLNKFIPNPQIIEKCSRNESFCIKIDNYPRQDLLQIFRTSKFMSNNFFGVDSITETNDLETKISSKNNLQPFCNSLEEVIFPEAGINTNNEWRFIVQDSNDNTNFKQGIRVEKCLNAGESCKFSEHLPIGYTTTCVQKYIFKKLVAIKDSKEIYYDHFKLPSCCTCMYSVNPELLTRKGGGIETQRSNQSLAEVLKKNKEIKI